MSLVVTNQLWLADTVQERTLVSPSFLHRHPRGMTFDLRAVYFRSVAEVRADIPGHVRGQRPNSHLPRGRESLQHAKPNVATTMVTVADLDITQG